MDDPHYDRFLPPAVCLLQHHLLMLLAWGEQAINAAPNPPCQTPLGPYITGAFAAPRVRAGLTSDRAPSSLESGHEHGYKRLRTSQGIRVSTHRRCR
ncbi:hypothetical protein NDU88_001803 [Pleurodeles waltl]|uniref:Uncharacterized protein n=1 Tax=Pleurodeles waltl TaxID=8319 RepID=A0AAV7P7W1_PLEWA|nr:hypothetical protein NDU88_001803 [Pleurodeles waltl]